MVSLDLLSFIGRGWFLGVVGLFGYSIVVVRSGLVRRARVWNGEARVSVSCSVGRARGLWCARVVDRSESMAGLPGRVYLAVGVADREVLLEVGLLFCW
jgi:hypothetical protein